MTDIVEQAIKDVQSRGRFRTRYAGQEPRVDETLVAEILNLRAEVDRLTKAHDEWRAACFGHGDKVLRFQDLLEAETSRADKAEAALADAIKALEYWNTSFDTGRSEPLYIARDNGNRVLASLTEGNGE